MKKLREAFPLLDGEARSLLVSLRPSDINLLVADIEIPANDHRFFLLQIIAVLLEALVILIDSILQSI